MLIDLKNPPHFLTLDPDSQTFSEGIEVTDSVRSCTATARGSRLPPSITRLSREWCGGWIGGTALITWGQINKPPPPDRVIVWCPLGHEIWPEPFVPTTAEELIHKVVSGKIYAGRPFLTRSDLLIIKTLLPSGQIKLSALGWKEARAAFDACASETAARFLSGTASP
jgi:hypothetical protein